MSEKITIEVSDLSKVSDGYHTIAELYDHRCLLFINLAILTGGNYMQDHYDGWDLISLFTEVQGGQISYHVPNKYRYLYKDKLQLDAELNKKFDGHTASDVLIRLQGLAENLEAKTK